MGNKAKDKETPIGVEVGLCAVVVSSVLFKYKCPILQEIRMWSMQECSQDNSSQVAMVLVPWIKINVEDVVVGDIGHINVLPLQEEDEDVSVEGAEVVDADDVEEQVETTRLM